MLKINYRPYYEDFLANLSQFYEIVVFTNAMPGYASSFINRTKSIQYCLYRSHTVREKHKISNKNTNRPISFVKDLSRLGRNLKKTIAVDN